MPKKLPAEQVIGRAELERHLASATTDARIEAVFTLKPPEGTQLLDEKQVRGTVDRIVKSATAKTGKSVGDVHVMPNVQSFVIAASPEVVRAVLNCGEVDSAMTNTQPEELAIEPKPRTAKKPPPRTGGKPRKGDT